MVFVDTDFCFTFTFGSKCIRNTCLQDLFSNYKTIVVVDCISQVEVGGTSGSRLEMMLMLRINGTHENLADRQTSVK